MKWIAISGTWEKTNEQVEKDVRNTVKKIINRSDGIITGGAPGVDYFATDEVMKLNPALDKIKIILPTSLDFYIRHTEKRVEEGLLDKKLSESLIKQLNAIRKINPKIFVEGKDIENKIHVEKWQYFERNDLIIKFADELVAFHVNNSEGVADAIKKAEKKKIPVKIFSYTIE